MVTTLSSLEVGLIVFLMIINIFMKTFDINKPRAGCRKTPLIVKKKVAIVNSKNDILKIYGSCKEAALGLDTNAAQISKCCLDNEYADIPYHRVKGYLLLHYDSRHLNKSSDDKVQ